MNREPLATDNAGGGGGKRKIEDDTIELAKQKAQAIAARFINDVHSKRPRTGSDSSSPTTATNQPPSFPVPYTTQANQYTGVPSSKKIVIPNAKVGVIIGRSGDMIKNIQQQSGAKIQIARDADANPTCLTRDVELMGTQEQISRAEALINEVIAEADAASSASTGNKNVGQLQPGSEQFVMKVPNDKVALIIGKGGETIKTMQSMTGARIQVVPLRLPPGDTSTERNVYISGRKEQIESAKELVNEVISGNRLKVLPSTNTYAQSAYPQATGWPPQGQPPVQQQLPYGYAQPVSYPMQLPPYYGGYPPQQTGWEQQSTTAVAPLQPQNTSYYAYGQQAPPTSTPPNISYNYSQISPTSYSYNQGYPQQPQYGQGMSGQAQAPPPDSEKPYANPPNGPPATSSQPDGSAAVQPSQSGYGTSTPSGQPNATGYSHPTTAAPTSTPASGYGAYPGYSVPPAPADYTQTGYQQTGYAQQPGGEILTQSSYYYGQSSYPTAQSAYYQVAYPSIPTPQAASQTRHEPANSLSQSQTAIHGTQGATGGDTTTGSGTVIVANQSENPQS